MSSLSKSQFITELKLGNALLASLSDAVVGSYIDKALRIYSDKLPKIMLSADNAVVDDQELYDYPVNALKILKLRDSSSKKEIAFTIENQDTEKAPTLVDGNWTLGTGWTSPIAGGVLQKSADGTGTATPLAATNIVAGSRYKVQITISALSVGSASYTLGDITGSTLSAATTYTDYITASTTGKLIITPTNTSRFTISSISIKSTANQIRPGNIIYKSTDSLIEADYYSDPLASNSVDMSTGYDYFDIEYTLLQAIETMNESGLEAIGYYVDYLALTAKASEAVMNQIDSDNPVSLTDADSGGASTTVNFGNKADSAKTYLQLAEMKLQAFNEATSMAYGTRG